MTTNSLFAVGAIEKPYDWRAPEITAYWNKIRADIAAKAHKDAHQYRDDSREHCVEKVIVHHEIAMRYAREAAAITARTS